MQALPSDRLVSARDAPVDRPGSITMRLRASTIAALTAVGRERGHTIKQVVAYALVRVCIAVIHSCRTWKTARRAAGSRRARQQRLPPGDDPGARQYMLTAIP
jgi:hypothetical protein